MKKNILIIILIFLAGLILTLSITTISASKDPAWLTFETAIEKGKKEQKPVIVDFYADWCSWCKKMDAETFSNKEISKILNEDFILARIDVEKKQKITYKGKSYSEIEFQRLFNVSGLPTMAFFDKNGDFITIIPGFVTHTQLKPILAYLSSECYLKKISFDQFTKSPDACNK
ncbi:MAG: thioredoxin fold domain-containing protein [Spirochaetes bacterium]|nr:thioredoxin fold domain-containing protein [Spirochaetota bacterium]